MLFIKPLMAITLLFITRIDIAFKLNDALLKLTALCFQNI